jgi:signal transduction histidine kinase
MGTTVGYASMLRSVYRKIPESEILENLDNIITSTVHMSEIVDALLLLSQVRKLDDVPIDAMDMGTMVIKALDRMEGYIEESEAQIVFPPNWPFTIGYGPWIVEVWVNYISNAIKYGGRPEKGVKPVVQLGWDVAASSQDNGPTSDAENGSMLRFWVLDNGWGLSEEEQKKLFIEFSRLNAQVSEGHGLGLSIVKRIVEKLGGKVGVESIPDKGNLFYFTLPAYEFGQG